DRLVRPRRRGVAAPDHHHRGEQGHGGPEGASKRRSVHRQVSEFLNGAGVRFLWRTDWSVSLITYADGTSMSTKMPGLWRREAGGGGKRVCGGRRLAQYKG